MNDTGNYAKGQKLRTSKLAVISPVLSILGFCIYLHFVTLEESVRSVLGVLIWQSFATVGIVFGAVALGKIRKGNGRIADRVSATLGIVMAGISFTFLFVCLIVTPAKRPPPISICGSHLHRLGIVMRLYANDFDGKYPTSDKWCDLLVENYDERHYVDAKTFICKSALRGGDKNRCHYAINPKAEPNSPPDMVLLFETKGGWNQFGGPEILTTENHKGKGCNVLFNKGRVEFVKPERLGELKWEVEESK